MWISIKAAIKSRMATFVLARMPRCECLQGEVDRLPCLGTADDCFGPLHVMYARFEGHHGDLLFPTNGVSELFLHAVKGLLLWRVGDLRELSVATATGEDALLLVHLDGPFGAIKPYLRARGQPGGRAHAHVDLGVVGQFVEDIDVVGNADGGERTTFIEPVRHMDLGHGHNPVAPAYPAHHGLIGSADIQGVVPTELPVVAPVQIAAPIDEAVLECLVLDG